MDNNHRVVDDLTEIHSYPIGRLVELIRADKAGRVNVMPTAVGDPVYILHWMTGRREYFITESVCSGIHLTGEIEMNPARKCKAKEYIVARYNGYFKHLPMTHLGTGWFTTERQAKEYAESVLSRPRLSDALRGIE